MISTTTACPRSRTETDALVASACFAVFANASEQTEQDGLGDLARDRDIGHLSHNGKRGARCQLIHRRSDSELSQRMQACGQFLQGRSRHVELCDCSTKVSGIDPAALGQRGRQFVQALAHSGAELLLEEMPSLVLGAHEPSTWSSRARTPAP